MTKPPPRHLDIVLAGAFFAAALAVRLHGLGWGETDFYEEATPMWKAWEMSGWGPERSLDPNPRFFHYPSLVFYVQMLGQGILYLILQATGRIESTLDFRVLFAMDRAPFFLTARTVTAVFGAATVAATYVLGRVAAGRAAGVLAALFLLLDPLHVHESQRVEVDVPLAAFATWTLIESILVTRRSGKGASLRAGLALGLAASAKYTGAFLAIPVAVAHFLAARPPRTRKDALLSLSVAYGAAILAFALTSPFVILDAGRAWHDLATEREHMTLGHFGGEEKGAVETYAKILTNDALGWPLALIVLAGVVVAAAQRRTWAWVLGSHVLVTLGILMSWTMVADRYLLFVLPALLVFGAALLARDSPEGAPQRLPRFARTALISAFAGFVLVSFGTSVHSSRAAPIDARTTAKRWIEARCPTGTFVLVEPRGPDFFDTVEFVRLDSDVRAKVGADLQKRIVLAELQLPMFQVGPERSAPFYDLALYPDADLVMTTSGVRSRYLRDPARFPQQVAFYADLDARFRRVQEFGHDAHGDPDLVLYANPSAGKPFALRDAPIGPKALVRKDGAPPAEEAYFYFVWGLDYETFGFMDEALCAYRIAQTYPPSREGLSKSLDAAVERCLAALPASEAPLLSNAR